MKIELLTEEGYQEYDLETIETIEITEENEIDIEIDLPEPEQTDLKIAAGQWNKIKIVSFGNWPETAMKLAKRCWKERNRLFSITVCGKTKIPHRRNCQKTFYLKYRITSPDQKIKKDIEDCIKKATVAAAGAFLLGGVGAVKVTFKSTLDLCINEKLGDPKNFFDYKFDTETICGKWSPI